MPLGWAPVAQRAGVCYVPPDRKTEGLFLSHSILANLTATRLESFSRFGVIAERARKASAQTLLKIVGVRDHGLKQPVERLSGGNQQKVLIGRCIRRAKRELLLLDDPTRGVDVGGREEIHGLIRDAAAGEHRDLRLHRTRRAARPRRRGRDDVQGVGRLDARGRRSPPRRCWAR